METVTRERTIQINQQSVDRSDMFYWQADRPMTMEECAIIFGQRQQVDDTDLVAMIAPALRNARGYETSNIERVEGGEHYTVGSVNVNRNFVLDGGQEVVGRFHPRGIRNGYFSVEAAVAGLAIAHGIPAAKPIAVRYAKKPKDMDLVVFEKAQGINMRHWLNAHPTDEAMLVGAVGRVMATIHTIRVDGYGFFDNNLARLTGQLNGIHTSYKQHLLAALPQNLAEITAANYITQKQANKITSLLEATDLADCDDPRLIHNDFADWNTLVHDGAVSAAIDWDEAHAGDPVADIACWSLFFPTSRLQMLLDGYRTVADLPANFDEKLHIYRLRYLVSKLALRHKKYAYQKDEIMHHLVKAGLDALAEESVYFGLDS